MIWLKRSGLLLVVVFLLPLTARAAELVVSPATEQTSVGSIITATIEVNTAGTAVNAAGATLTFPTDLLKLIAVSKADSILALTAVDSANANTTGQISVSGGLPSPGYDGDRGTILKITWEALAPGQAKVDLTGGKILANDGQGTNLLSRQSGANYTITATAAAPATTPPVVGSLEFPNEGSWYTRSEATMVWTNPAGLSGVSYVLDHQPLTAPDETVDTTDNSVVLPIAEDGLWYFHLRGHYGSVWSAPTHFVLHRDATPPEPFTLEVRRDRGLADPSPSILFATTDAASGVATYAISVDGATTKPAQSPFQVVATRSGNYQIVVTAVDQAGNSQVSATTFTVAGYTAPMITDVTTPLILLQTMTIRGTAQAGDRVNIFVDGKFIGSTLVSPPSTAVADGTTVRLPWVFTADQPLAPGEHRLTATATSTRGQTSIQSDPRLLTVRGNRIQFGGRTIGTFAVAPLFGLVIVALMAAMTWFIWRLRQSLRQFERQQAVVDLDVRSLRRAIDRGELSTQDIENALAIIDAEVIGRRPAARSKRRPTKKSV